MGRSYQIFKIDISSAQTTKTDHTTVKYFIIPVLALLTCPLLAQPDSIRLLTWDLHSFLQQVAQASPTARNAALLPLQAEAALRVARGAFDPKLYSDWQQKTFSGKEYYGLNQSGIKVQTPFGPTVKSEFNTASGLYLNPEEKLPAQGQALVGITLPLLNGLLTDPARAGLRQARLDVRLLEASQQSLLNDLLFDAAAAFVEWQVAWEQIQLFQQASRVAYTRYLAIRESFIQGDKPATDTLEAFIQYQNRMFDLNEASLVLRTRSQTLEAFLSSNAHTPDTPRFLYEAPRSEPDTNAAPLPTFLNILPAHPEIQALSVELQKLDVERQLASEQLKPSLNLSYNLLGTGFQFNPSGNALGNMLLQNNKWGIDFSFPLFLRKERGKLELVRIKSVSTENKVLQKQILLETKIRNYYSEWETSSTQATLYRGIAENYSQLLQAEQIKYDLGESSVFLLNTREQKLLEAQIKRIKLSGTARKSLLALYWASGQLPTRFL